MVQQTQLSLFGQLIRGLDDIHSRVYIGLAVAFYVIPVSLISILFISASVDSEYDLAYIALFWVAIVILPLMLTVGVFVVYRATFTNRTYLTDHDDDLGALTTEERQWDHVINKALDWHRFIMPLCLLNMFITLTSGFLLFTDVSGADSDTVLAAAAEAADIDDIYFGYYDVKLVYGTVAVRIPGSVFYLGLLGFMVHFLEMTRRRYVSRNIVPRFYLISAFRLIQVLIIVAVTHLFLRALGDDPYVMLVTAFVVGMFPLQLLIPVVESARQRLGMSKQAELSVTLINGIDNTLESLLQEENIDSVQILATTDTNEIHKRTAIPLRTLANWQRQARLFNALGTEELVHRFARVGINDFDDLAVLLKSQSADDVSPTTFTDDFTAAMRIKPDDEAYAPDAFWRFLIQVLVREYQAEFETTQPVNDEIPEAENIVLESPVG